VRPADHQDHITQSHFDLPDRALLPGELLLHLRPKHRLKKP
jgi:hypothetical protein